MFVSKAERWTYDAEVDPEIVIVDQGSLQVGC
jgi:hypothetical protein